MNWIKSPAVLCLTHIVRCFLTFVLLAIKWWALLVCQGLFLAFGIQKWAEKILALMYFEYSARKWANQSMSFLNYLFRRWWIVWERKKTGRGRDCKVKGRGCCDFKESGRRRLCWEGDIWANVQKRGRKIFQMSRERTFQAGGPTSAKTLRQKHTYDVLRNIKDVWVLFLFC